MQVTVLVSGTGSNLRSLVENARSYKITSVITNNPESIGAKWATSEGISSSVVAKSRETSKSDFIDKLLKAVSDTNPDVVVLAGFMVILPRVFIETFPNRIINIHPSLLPKHPGLNTHQRAIDAGDTHHGCSVHIVDSGIDTGPILAQSVVEVLRDDTAISLGARTLRQEHLLFPWVLNAWCSGGIQYNSGVVSYSKTITTEAGMNGFLLNKQPAKQCV